MSILASFMVPHPPLILKEVGKGREKQIEKTIDSYQQIAEDISLINPDTIIISSPHTTYYSDCFYVSGSTNVRGSFANFGAPEVTYNEEIDQELVNEIDNISQKKGFPIKVEKNDILDHGTMVPLYFIRKKLPKTKMKERSYLLLAGIYLINYRNMDHMDL